MHVVFVEPVFPSSQREFVRGLVQVGATVSAIGEWPRDALDEDLRRWVVHYEQVPTVVDADAVTNRLEAIAARLPVDRLEATIEAHVLAAAEARDRLGIPGTPLRTVHLCRDKVAMKEALRAGGVPTAAAVGSAVPGELEAFAERVGFPVVVKPRTGSDSSHTLRVDDVGALREALARRGVGHGGQAVVEEWLEGHEAFYDTITIGGRVAQEFVTHCYPNVLEATRTRWISPQLVSTNRFESAPGYQEVLELGRRVNELLGIETSATHMEWFFGPEGLRFSEVACRPPGLRMLELHSAGNDLDLYHEWAMAVVWGRTSRKASRRLSAGLIALRPDRDGVISHYEGLEEIYGRFGEWILDAYLPPPGTPTRPVEDGYTANPWMRVRHPDYDELRTMLDTVGETVQVRAT